MAMPRDRSSFYIFYRCRRGKVRCGRLLELNAEWADRLKLRRRHRHLQLQLLPLRQLVVAGVRALERPQLARPARVHAAKTEAKSRENSRTPGGSRCCGKDCLALRS